MAKKATNENIKTKKEVSEAINHFIKTHYEEMTDNQMASVMGISYGSVMNRRNNLGLRKSGAKPKESQSIYQKILAYNQQHGQK